MTAPTDHEVAEEGLAYFHNAGDAGDREYVRAIRAVIAGTGTPDVRTNGDGSLDEIVGRGPFHLEQMSARHWWLQLGPHAVNLTARGAIAARVDRNEYRTEPAADHSAGAGNMVDVHTCSYHCERPACIKSQRDELAEKAMHAERSNASMGVTDEMVERAASKWCSFTDRPLELLTNFQRSCALRDFRAVLEAALLEQQADARPAEREAR